MSQSLCSTCQSIEFRNYIYESRFIPTTLGSWRRIFSRHGCPFCNLVRDAILSHETQPSPKSIVKLSNWKSWKRCTSYNEYHGIRRMNYSNEFDLHSYASKTRTLSRYQLDVYWVANSGKRSHVYLRPLHPGPFFGRIVDQDYADLALCRKWLNICDEHHTGLWEQCTSQKSLDQFLQYYLRLIDVEKMIIVRGLPDWTEYVALSYVWGEDRMKRARPPGWEMPRTLRVNVRTDKYGVETIMLPGELLCTIRDAIEVTRSIGYRYLWVDSLCIIQDDKQEKDFQISMMDEIYNNATLTIAAGSGLRKFIGSCSIRCPLRTQILTTSLLRCRLGFARH
jgi:hypothetical protein